MVAATVPLDRQKNIADVPDLIRTQIGAASAAQGALADTAVQPGDLKDVNVEWFGAVADYSGSTRSGTDNTEAFAAALSFCKANRKKLAVPGGLYFFNGGSIIDDGTVPIVGDGQSVTYLVFGGTPAKSVISRAKWQSSYDTGDYTTNVDDPVSYGVLVTGTSVSLSDLTVMTNHDANKVYPLPFNSATDYPTSNYDYGVVVQRASVALRSIDVTGVWTKAALAIDGSNVGGIGDGFYAENCNFFGGFGLDIIGARGQPVSGDDYLDLTTLDTRTSGGISDVRFVGCNIGDTSRGTRLNINGTNKRVRRSLTGGGMNINGQVGPNSAKRIQGIAFFKCRFSASDPTVYKINYANRVEFYSCHSEAIGGCYDVDGVTALPASAMSVISTANAREISFYGGEKSGEVDARVMKYATGQIVSEFGFDNGTRRLIVPTLGDSGSWTPTIVAVTPGTPAVSTAFGRYIRIGQLVTCWGRITFTAVTGMAGNITLEGWPFLCTNEFGNSYDPIVTLQTNTVTLGTGGGQGLINNNTKQASLFKIVSGGATVNMTAADLVATSRFDFTCTYITSDP